MSSPTTTAAPANPDVASGLTWRLVRADGRPGDVVAFEESVLTFFLEAADLLGVPKSVAMIYGICFASVEPLCYSDIRERLNISAGSVSQGLRVLCDIGALKLATADCFPANSPALARADAKRRDYYLPDMELRKLVLHFLENRLQKQLNSGSQRLKAMKEAIPAGDEAAVKTLNGRLKQLESWHGKARAAVPVVRSFLKLS